MTVPHSSKKERKGTISLYIERLLHSEQEWKENFDVGTFKVGKYQTQKRSE